MGLIRMGSFSWLTIAPTRLVSKIPICPKQPGLFHCSIENLGFPLIKMANRKIASGNPAYLGKLYCNNLLFP